MRLYHPHYRPDIDGLRALAVLAVVLFHAFPGLLQGGFIGVDVFFVISGYLISSILFASLAQGRFSLRLFYVRRIRRILPALLTVMLTLLGAGWLLLTPDEYAELGHHLLAGASFLSNLQLYKESGYFDHAAEAKPLLHLWSLAIEEQFYIFWPLILAGAWRLRRRGWWPGLILLLLSLGGNLWFIQKNPSATFYLPLFRFWELLAGGLLAYWQLHRREPTRPLPVLSWLAAGLMLLSWFVIDRSRAFPGAWALLPVLAALGWMAAGADAPVNRRLLSQRAVVAVGLISYPLYLWHWPLLSLLHVLQGGQPVWWARGLAVLLAVLLAWATYRWIERPLRFGKSRWMTPGLLLGLVLLGYAGQQTWQAQGWPQRLSAAQVQHWQQAQAYPHLPFRNDACAQRYPQLGALDACLLSQNRPPEVALIGDSNSNQYYQSLAAQLPQTSVLNLGAWGCLPFVGPDFQGKNDCARKQQQVLAAVLAEPSLHTIYVVGHWSYLASGHFAESGNGWRLPAPLTLEAAQGFVANGRAVLDKLQRSGKHLVLLQDLPDLDFGIQSCFDYRPGYVPLSPRSPCAIDRAAYQARSAAVHQQLDTLLGEFPAIATFDPASVLCDAQRCWAARNGEAWYFNGDHLNRAGADAVVRQLLITQPPGGPHAP